ncbi:MAG: hypothetical protein AVDCRST_MAG33-2419 [uncultured Thermomicrobiales bacterium]|uniref:Putative regulatory protein FmdB zinc ribbon domain-containing protein n=1 Tax=uncultured Thermomicrobiales bacterium TaxID=1645740 RepID=A0A6J4V6X4_9BACT|nr:MAG: hypothetical protein AVDCRST_MAG33-2419 [uncultured Thermomicrobiales bacterium]
MPTYAFRCPDCGGTFDERRTFAHSDDPVTCPACGGGGATKQFGTPMVLRKGMAARALLEAPGRVPVASASAAHSSGCPCCSGGSVPPASPTID